MRQRRRRPIHGGIQSPPFAGFKTLPTLQCRCAHIGSWRIGSRILFQKRNTARTRMTGKWFLPGRRKIVTDWQSPEGKPKCPGATIGTRKITGTLKHCASPCLWFLPQLWFSFGGSLPQTMVPATEQSSFLLSFAQRGIPRQSLRTLHRDPRHRTIAAPTVPRRAQLRHKHWSAKGCSAAPHGRVCHLPDC
jgi:hypothetical protein